MKHRVALRYRDLDLYGHVNHIAYHDLMDQARASYVADANGGRLIDMVVRHVAVDYLAEVRGEDRHVDVHTSVEAIGRRSITFLHELIRPDGVVAATAWIVTVAFDPRTRGSRPVTDAERALFVAVSNRDGVPLPGVGGSRRASPSGREESTMKVGDYTVDVARDGQFLCPVDFEYPNIESQRWTPWRHLLADGDKVVNEFGAFVVRGGDRIVLVDLGFGPAEVPEWRSGALLDSLAELGIAPGDVTDVVFTHLHFDHIGWASVGGEVTFPNATYHCEASDWEHFTVGYDPRPEELTFPEEMLPVNKLAPVADRMRKWTGAAEIVPGIEAIPTPGHSPGHCSIRVVSDGQAVVLAGDIAHHQAEFIEPDWEGVADVDLELAARSRQELKEHLAQTGTPFFGAHFRDFEVGRVVRAGDGYAWEPLGVTTT